MAISFNVVHKNVLYSQEIWPILSKVSKLNRQKFYQLKYLPSNFLHVCQIIALEFNLTQSVDASKKIHAILKG